MGIRIGVAGTGAHAQHYVRLLNAHPLVEELVLADLIPDYIEAMPTRHLGEKPVKYVPNGEKYELKSTGWIWDNEEVELTLGPPQEGE